MCCRTIVNLFLSFIRGYYTVTHLFRQYLYSCISSVIHALQNNLTVPNKLIDNERSVHCIVINKLYEGFQQICLGAYRNTYTGRMQKWTTILLLTLNRMMRFLTYTSKKICQYRDNGHFVPCTNVI